MPTGTQGTGNNAIAGELIGGQSAASESREHPTPFSSMFAMPGDMVDLHMVPELPQPQEWQELDRQPTRHRPRQGKAKRAP